MLHQARHSRTDRARHGHQDQHLEDAIPSLVKLKVDAKDIDEIKADDERDAVQRCESLAKELAERPLLLVRHSAVADEIYLTKQYEHG